METLCAIVRSTYQTWNVISLDVWGNRHDGFEVNAAYTTGRSIDLPPNIYNTDTVLRALYDAGEITQVKGGACEFHESDIYVTNAKTGRPILTLSLVSP